MFILAIIVETMIGDTIPVNDVRNSIAEKYAMPKPSFWRISGIWYI